MVPTTQLLPSLSSRVGILQLNNPSSLNALTLEMIRSMTPTLHAWQSAGVRATIMVGTPRTGRDGTSKPAFCAGGDVKDVYLAGLAGDPSNTLQADFFREEYRLDHMLATQPPHIPQVSLWDGVVMGGGVGLSVHGKYRVATENTLFAMPGETCECSVQLSMYAHCIMMLCSFLNGHFFCAPHNIRMQNRTISGCGGKLVDTEAETVQSIQG